MADKYKRSRFRNFFFDCDSKDEPIGVLHSSLQQQKRSSECITLDARLNPLRFSREILFPVRSTSGAVDNSKAESIQFVSSALMIDDRVFVFYGITIANLSLRIFRKT